MHKLFNIFYGLFIGMLVLVGVVFLASLTPINTGIEAKIVQSGSMEPAIGVGALVFIRTSESYRAGDVVAFGDRSSSAIATTHRVVSVGSENGRAVYTTKGDANEEADSQLVLKSDVIGKVFVSVPYAGFVLDFARQPLGFALLIGVPALLVILAELAAIAQELVRMWRRKHRLVASAQRVPRGLSPPARVPRRAYSIEYVRRFVMDEIFIPVRIFADSTGSTGSQQASSLQEKRLGDLPVQHYVGAFSSSLAAIFIALLVSFEGTGGTLSYFRDMETSTGNTFSAATEFTPLLVAGAGGGGGGPVGSLVLEEPLFAEDVSEAEGDIDDGAHEEEIPAEVVEEITPSAEEDRSRETRDERVDREERNEETVALEENVVEENPVSPPDVGGNGVGEVVPASE